MESPYEVHDYIRAYLGDTSEAKEFAKQFLERRAKQKASQRQQPPQPPQPPQQQVGGGAERVAMREHRCLDILSTREMESRTKVPFLYVG